VASDIAGSISRRSSHLTANYLSSSGWLRQMTDPHAKPRNYAVVIMVISSNSSNSVFLLQTVVLREDGFGAALEKQRRGKRGKKKKKCESVSTCAK